MLSPALSVEVEWEQTLLAVPSPNCGFIRRHSGIKGRLNVTPDYVCPGGIDQARTVDCRPITHVEFDGSLLGVEASFCYLGHMLSWR